MRIKRGDGTSRTKPESYAAAHRFIRVELRSVRKQLTAEPIATLRGQALKGDIEGAHKGLMKILGRRET